MIRHNSKYSIIKMSKLLKYVKFATSLSKPIKIKQNLIQITSYINKNETKINIFRMSPTVLIKTIKNVKMYSPYRVLWTLSILKWMGFDDGDEKKESELIMTLKRAVLSTQRGEFDKAEQLLHIALRLAQQQQNSQGVLYCYDLMANLAMERLELDKAERLFVSVMQMLLSDGAEQDDLKVILKYYFIFSNVQQYNTNLKSFNLYFSLLYQYKLHTFRLHCSKQ